MSLKHLLMALVLVFGAASADAQEAPLLSGTFLIKVYWGQGGGVITNPQVQALPGNPLITGEPRATVTYVGSLNFRIGADGPDTIGDFFATGTSTSISGLNEATAALIMSTPPFANTTVLDITFNSGAISNGNISHDDGISLYVNDSLKTPSPAAAPTVETSTPFTSPAGSYRLIYVAANGRPQVLIARGTPVATPDFVDFGCRLDLTETSISSQFQFVLPASDSAKFCPENNDGTLRLTCSGQIPPPYDGRVIDDSSITCLISRSQCGINDVKEANVKSIKVNTGGLAELVCEVTPQ